MGVSELCHRPLYIPPSLDGNSVLFWIFRHPCYSSFVNYLSVAGYSSVCGFRVSREVTQQHVTDLMKLWVGHGPFSISCLWIPTASSYSPRNQQGKYNTKAKREMNRLVLAGSYTWVEAIFLLGQLFSESLNTTRSFSSPPSLIAADLKMMLIVRFRIVVGGYLFPAAQTWTNHTEVILFGIVFGQ